MLTEAKESIIEKTFIRNKQEEVMNRFTKKLVCTALAAVLGTAALTGCGKIDGTKALITSGEDTVSVGIGNLMLRMNQAQMLSYYAMLGGSPAGMWEQDAGEGKTYADTAKEDVVDQLENMILLKQHAEEYKVSVSEDEEKKIQEAAKAFMEANTEETIRKLAVNQADIEKLLTLYTYQNKMYDPMTADVDTNVEDSEAAQSKLTYCKVDTSDKQDDAGNNVALTEEEKAAKKDQAQTVLDKLLASEKPEEADMDALAKEVDEKLSAEELTFDEEDTVLDEKVKEVVKSLKDGQVHETVIEGENAYYVVRMDSVLDREATDKEKESIAEQRKQDAYDELLKKWGEKTEMKLDKKEWKKVTLTDNDQYTLKMPQEEENTTEE